MSPETLAHLGRLANLLDAGLREPANAHALREVHLHVLGYLARANRFSDTLTHLARYLSLTRGSLSQTLKTLEERGLVTRLPDRNDGRVTHFRLSPQGHTLLDAISPLPPFAGLPSGDPADRILEAALEACLRRIQSAHDLPTFGACRTCRHHLHGASGSSCAHFDASLPPETHDQICAAHVWGEA